MLHRKRLVVVGIIMCYVVLTLPPLSANNGRQGWPIQRPPQKIIVAEKAVSFEENMLLQSLSGLAAQAVNEGRFDTMLWLPTRYEHYETTIFEGTLKALGITQTEKKNTEELIRILKKKGVVKGYILYSSEDGSSNPATILASIFKGVLIERSQEEFAKKNGLKLLKDARGMSVMDCFEKYKDKLDNSSILSVPSNIYLMRDYAISHNLMLYSVEYDHLDEFLSWVKPLSPVLGWGCNSEYDSTHIISQWGLYNTASNACENLPVISSAWNKVDILKKEEIVPENIDFSDSASCHSFIMSDGDNEQWTMNAYVTSDTYIGNNEASSKGMNWTMVPGVISVISPFTWNEAASKLGIESTVIEYGGGYHYPDEFATKRENRAELLREWAKRINERMLATGIKVFGFICSDVSSDKAQEAFQIFAEELTGITGMLAIQFFPYELDGQIYWKTNKEGIDIPVFTTRYSIWNEVNPYRPRAGVPEFIASEINRDFFVASDAGDNILSATIAHAWSDYSKTSMVTPSPAIGINSMLATQKMLVPQIKAVSVNELLWRIRMKCRPEQTRELIKKCSNGKKQ